MRLGASSTGLTAVVRVESAGPPAGAAASFGRDIPDCLQPTAWLSKEPPARVPTAFIRFRREKRSPGTGYFEASISRPRHSIECETGQRATASVGIFHPEAFGPPHALTTLVAGYPEPSMKILRDLQQKAVTAARPPPRGSGMVPVRTWSRRVRVRVRAAVRRGRRTRLGRLASSTGVVRLVLCITALAGISAAAGVYHVYFDRSGLPDLEGFNRFEFSTVGTIYDAHGQPLKEMAAESRRITRYDEIPPIVRDAILAAEDKNFFSHSGIDYTGFARILCKIKFGDLIGRLFRMGRRDAANNSAIFPQGGSTITQQLVRGYFLKTAMAQENSDQLRHGGWMARVVSCVIGARTVNMMARKVEEIRLSLWVEEQMRERFGSKRRAKEEILARYASLIYMGNGQYGVGKGAEYYFGRSLGTLTAEDADKAALLAGTAKSARYYAPNASESKRVLQRRNQTLVLMAARGFISAEQARRASGRPLEVVAPHKDKMTGTSAVVDTVLDELTGRQADLGVQDLLQGRIQVYSTVDTGVQEIANQALERGLLLYEKRHPRARGLVQGSVVVLRNRDAGILAETDRESV